MLCLAISLEYNNLWIVFMLEVLFCPSNTGTDVRSHLTVNSDWLKVQALLVLMLRSNLP